MTKRKILNNIEKIYYMLQENDCNHWFRDNADMLSLAEYLDKKGCIAMPFAVGDTVYNVLPSKLFKNRILEEKVERFYVIAQTDKGIIPIDMFGKTVFLTREEAEQALRKEDE